MKTEKLLLIGAAIVAAYFIFRKKPLLETAVVNKTDEQKSDEIVEAEKPDFAIKPKPVEISGIIM